MKRPGNIRVRNRAAILILIPVTTLLWLIGWTLFWTSTKKQYPKPPRQANMTITAGILLENHEEITT